MQSTLPGTSSDATSELQSDVMRFEGRFSSLLHNAYEPLLTSTPAHVRLVAARELLAYSSGALDVAAGRAPAANLLDMVTLVELCRTATRRRWNLDVYPVAASLRDAVDAAAADVWRIAERALSEGQCAALRDVITRWLKENPDLDRVAGVRLSEFARFSATDGAARGLLANVKDAVRTADEARMLGDRALYLAQRMPFLLRMHMGLATKELFDDARREISTVVGDPRLARGRVLRGVIGAAGGVAGVCAVSWVLARALDRRLAR